MASQPSDRLKAIVAAARARAAEATPPPAGAGQETRRVEALLDRAEELPDSRALARMYRERDLLDRLPDDEDSPRGNLYSPPPASAPGAAASPAQPPLSPTQVRAVMDQLRQQFGDTDYVTFVPRPVVAEVIPLADDAPAESAETRDVVYLLGTIVAVLVIGVFVFLALQGPLRYRPPATGGSPSPGAAARH